jgi:hypothetical protein
MDEKGQPEVTRRIAVSSPVNGRHYELWRTPEVKPGYHLYGYQDGVEIARKPVASELRGRIEFERRVEEHSA